ncbi:hypothetical protein N656DRAFT_802990 [Canariomyces notabilis]|uniref:MARVEL domain-containing protein n=1 Tax=Canariomyces notabilis TaxID=2074819 RepID=A0AAN6QBE6_9PEZI|nr:hypothetical protein N656DRAFT_802990 [Canariomyces arenarius]
MGVVTKALHVTLRLWQLISSVIVLGILARFLHYVARGGGGRDGRVIYGIIAASISTLFALALLAPFKWAFWAFPMDLILFIMWLIAFSLFATRARNCSAGWFFSYWRPYWSEAWEDSNGDGQQGTSGCGPWRTVLAFSFMAMIAFLASAILGAIVLARRLQKKRREKRG